MAPRGRREMDEKAVPYVLLKALKGSAARLPGFTVYDWPFEEADSFFYVETEDHRRFSVHVEEFARFQDGSAHF
jgi:hypothetical protein